MTPLSLLPWICACFVSSTLFSHTVALRLTLLLICVGLVVAALVKGETAINPPPPLWLVLVFAPWAAWCALSLVWSVEPDRTVKELRNEIGYVALAFCVCYYAAQAPRAARAIVPVLGTALLVLCALAYYHFAQNRPMYDEAWHAGPGGLSSALLTLMPVVLIGTWYAHRTGRVRVAWLGVALTPMLLVAAYATFNRTVWFGFAGQILLIAALLVRRGKISFAAPMKIVVAVLAVAIVSGAAYMASHIQAERGQIDTVAAFSKDMRVKLWPEVLDYIKERPLTGYGFGRGLLRNSLSENHQTMLWHAHNLFLDTMLQLGVPGVLLLLALIGATLRQGLRMANSHDDTAAACGLVVTGVVAGMLIRNMTDTLWVRQNALLYWSVLGFMFAWGRARVAGARSQ
jgi:O-antigen ligase